MCLIGREFCSYDALSAVHHHAAVFCFEPPNYMVVIRDTLKNEAVQAFVSEMWLIDVR